MNSGSIANPDGLLPTRRSLIERLRNLDDQPSGAEQTKRVGKGAGQSGGRSWRFFSVRHAEPHGTRYSKVHVTGTRHSVFVFRNFMEKPEDAVTAKLLDSIVAAVSLR